MLEQTSVELKETGKTGITEKACVPGTAIKDDPWLQTVTSTNNTHPLPQKIPGKTMTQTCTGNKCLGQGL